MAPKTLDQYTRAERTQMVGMWCDHDDRGRIKQSVITNIVDVRGDDGRMRQVASLYWPEQKHWHFNGEELATVTPRFDLLRAWTPDGKPVEAEPQTNEVVRGFVCRDDVERIHLPDGTAVHRFVTDWEEQA